MIAEELLSKCCGCGACQAICPVKAIQMEYNNKGFLEPHIEINKCVGCKLCVNTCPVNVLNRKNSVKRKDELLVGYNRDIEEQLASSSGGVFSLLAKHIIKEKRGVVYGAVFDEGWSVIHQRAEKDWKPMMTSKYVQSRLEHIYTYVAEDLINGRIVLFTGTPCQISAVKRYIEQRKINQDNLVCVGVVCHGAPSRKVWKDYLKRKTHGKIIKRISFRDKFYSWSDYCLTIECEDGSFYRKSLRLDAYLLAFVNNLILRDSCYNCQFKYDNYQSDITLADAWGVGKFGPQIKDSRGVSEILLHTDKGKMLFENIKQHLNFEKVDIKVALGFNSAAYESVKKGEKREAFFEKWRKTGRLSDRMLLYYSGFSLKSRIKRIIKIVLKGGRKK